MSAEPPGNKRGWGSRLRSVPDLHLWHEVARSVLPLKAKPGPRKAQAQAQPAESAAETPVPPPPSPPHPAQRPKQPVVRERRAVASAPPPLSGLDRRMRQRLGRGKLEVEARLDLHGLGAELAMVQLRRFLAEAQSRGHRLVLVITGKGPSPFARHTLHGRTLSDAPERQGRLRLLVPQWLEGDLRHLVAGYQPAHPRHGGGGALYVRLRRRDR